MGLLNRMFGVGTPTSRVQMIASVDSYVAGEQYDIPVELADRFIVRGYASGALSKEHTPEERATINANHQTVGL